MLYHITAHYINYIKSPHLTSHSITSRHVTSHHIISYHITSRYIHTCTHYACTRTYSHRHIITKRYRGEGNKKPKCTCILCTYVCMYVCVCMCICIYIYIHIHTYIHTYKHTYIHTYTSFHCFARRRGKRKADPVESLGVWVRVQFRRWPSREFRQAEPPTCVDFKGPTGNWLSLLGRGPTFRTLAGKY